MIIMIIMMMMMMMMMMIFFFFGGGGGGVEGVRSRGPTNVRYIFRVASFFPFN